LSAEDAAGNKTVDCEGSFKAEGSDDDDDVSQVVEQPVPPVVKLTGIGRKYIKGDIVDYRLELKNASSLKQMTFEVTGTHVKELWKISGESVDKSSSFSTSGWTPGSYRYFLQIVNDSDRIKEITGDFELGLDIDSESPEGSITGIKLLYLVGDVIDFEIYARDNRIIREVVFEIPAAGLKKSWNVGQPTFEMKSSKMESPLSTKEWNTDFYEYSLRLIDQAGNETKIEKAFNLRNIFSEGIPDIQLQNRSRPLENQRPGK